VNEKPEVESGGARLEINEFSSSEPVAIAVDLGEWR